jgi:hypothetical protein
MTDDENIKNAGVNAAEAFHQWKMLSESEDPQMQEVSDAWDLLILKNEQYGMLTAEMRAKGEKPCEGCPE